MSAAAGAGRKNGRKQPGPTLAHRAQFYAMRGTIEALRALSWDRGVAIGAKLGELGYRPLGIRKRVVERQIAAAFPELSPKEVIDLARESYRHLGRSSIEAALLGSIGRQRLISLVETVDGWEMLEEALAPGKGVVLVTGHIGNWELGGAYIAARGVPLDAIGRGMANPLFDAYLTRTREQMGMTVVHDSEAVRRTPRSLRAGRAVGFLADQGVLGLASTFVPFFGRPAKTPRGPAVFALRFGVPVLFVVAIRKPNGRYRLVIERVEITRTGDKDRDVDAIVARYTELLEKWVRAEPSQYFWQHRRWKRQPPDTPPELRDPSA
ncbi:MAG TPA: lysophospholipid acyltransferase family protein [Gemmatimonadaceae bacterium]|nr:lysophospholipid acyltransferase family protein [Gemmatimonadaceae bacterium]